MRYIICQSTMNLIVFFETFRVACIGHSLNEQFDFWNKKIILFCKILKSYQKYDALNHMNNVNSFYSRIQGLYCVNWGVSSNYINRYMMNFSHCKENIWVWTVRRSRFWSWKDCEKECVIFLCIRYEKKIF